MAKQKPTPEEVIQQLRDVRSQIEEDLAPMTSDQRRNLRDRTKHSPETISAAVSAIDLSANISAAIGLSSDQVKALMILLTRWVAVESDVRALLNGVSSANLKRRHRLDMIADHVFAVTKQLVRWPENDHLIPIYEEMSRLRKLERQKKRKKSGEEDSTPS